MLYRTAAVLILLFDLGHSVGCPWSDAAWAVDLGGVRSTQFHIAGFSRTYADFYVGFGLIVSVFLLLAAILAWQMGGVSMETLRQMRITAWALALCFGAVAVLS